MSHWLKSTTLKSYKFGDKVIPSYKEPFLELSDDEYIKLTAHPVVNSLIKGGSVLHSDVEPSEVSRSADKLMDSNAKLKLKLSQLQAENEQLKKTTHSDLADVNDQLNKQIEAMKAELEKAKADAEATKAEAVEELKKMQAELDKAKAKKGGN